MIESNSGVAKVKTSHRKKARNILVQAVYQWQLSKNPVEEIEAQYRTDNAGKIDWDFFHEAFSFISGHTPEIDKGFEESLDRSIEQLDPIELAILRLGSFEFQQRIDVPYKVVINEYVDLSKRFGATDSHKYINGILDKVARKFRQTEINARK